MTSYFLYKGKIRRKKKIITSFFFNIAKVSLKILSTCNNCLTGQVKLFALICSRAMSISSSQQRVQFEIQIQNETIKHRFVTLQSIICQLWSKNSMAFVCGFYLAHDWYLNVIYDVVIFSKEKKMKKLLKPNFSNLLIYEFNDWKASTSVIRCVP